MLFNSLTLAFLSGLASTNALALPKDTFHTKSLVARKAGDQAVTQLLQLAPGSASCNGAPVPGECRTAEQAAPFLIQAFKDYNIYNVNEIAMILSLLAFETEDFKYNTGLAMNGETTPPAGKGTRNLQDAENNLKYARSIPALAPQVDKITKATSAAGLTDEQKNAVRALVLSDEYSWASAMWYYTTEPLCVPEKAKIQAGGPDALPAYIRCLKTEPATKRDEKLALARAAFGI
ncbi:hypothetical protein GLAREA_05676 [Glarea lozoyensis ATCC 20868]|uniref:Uncharacterized protein n=2 Tax=Glarea lozoyensis TaxID=101852 RepID=S3EDI5_GLAL2|nr:uncharacterized protein GLAREA_05676 [Glarea lozoyensis ATCC 20868]EHK98828.1 hypothetical protein M7I_5337 [Glarea lozoyensis 74030]EPE36338.1 hypothetical protein GLAREA_05676 [Glarea lozoyensis ATCC 20868]